MVPITFEKDPSRHRSGPSRYVIRQTGRVGHAENPRREHRVCVLHRRSKGSSKERHRKTPSGGRPSKLQDLSHGRRVRLTAAKLPNTFLTLPRERNLDLSLYPIIRLSNSGRIATLGGSTASPESSPSEKYSSLEWTFSFVRSFLRASRAASTWSFRRNDQYAMSSRVTGP